MKLMIMGYGQHGKDTVCEILNKIHAIYPILKDLIGYQTIEECYNDRGNHRALWFELIKAFNHHDKARLARLIYTDSYVYCGVRNIEEFKAIKEAGLFDYAIWVDASVRVSAETTNSCTVTEDLADYTISNNGSLIELESTVSEMFKVLTVCNEFDKRGW
jgi:hypothetical protein